MCLASIVEEFRDDIFEYNLENHQLEHRPKNHAVTVSSCAPLFTHVMMTTGTVLIFTFSGVYIVEQILSDVKVKPACISEHQSSMYLRMVNL